MSQRLFDRLQAIGRLPTPSHVVLRLLELTHREDVSVDEVADALAQDPGLAAKVLRFANSPMAGIPREVTSLQRAVALIGVRGVKMAALSFTVLRPTGAEVCPGFNQEQFALQSLGCGVAARILASFVQRVQPEEAFLAGLLSQIGRAVLAIGIPEDYAKVLAEAQHVPRDLPPLETRVLGDAYPAIGAELLRSWQIPEPLCEAIEKFRELEGDRQAPPLAKVLNVAEIVAELICPEAKGRSPDAHAFVEAAGSTLGIESERCADLVNVIATELESARATLDVTEGTMRSPDDIENEVRERIAELTLAMHLENRTMAQQQEELMHRAITDALTGVGNRVAFDARLSLELQRALRSATPFGLLMIDVDRFKVFNDTYGHQAGDRVLQVVAHVLAANIRKVDHVARYGGEEFAVIAPEASAEGVSILMERLRRAVEEATVAWEGDRLGVTISIGAAVFTDIQSEGDVSNIIRAADAQLYAAKRNGRNRAEIAVDSLATATVGAGI